MKLWVNQCHVKLSVYLKLIVCSYHITHWQSTQCTYKSLHVENVLQYWCPGCSSMDPASHRDTEGVQFQKCPSKNLCRRESWRNLTWERSRNVANVLAKMMKGRTEKKIRHVVMVNKSANRNGQFVWRIWTKIVFDRIGVIVDCFKWQEEKNGIDRKKEKEWRRREWKEFWQRKKEGKRRTKLWNSEAQKQAQNAINIKREKKEDW